MAYFYWSCFTVSGTAFFFFTPLFFLTLSLFHAPARFSFRIMFHVLTPELEAETKKAVDSLKGPVNDLNKNLPEFPKLVDTGFVRFAKQDLESMSPEYNRDFHEWLQNGAISDFITKMASTYKHFDADVHANDGGDPNKYVRVKKRRVILGGLGSIWVDLPMTGSVENKEVTKWTRAAFVYTDDKWVVFFDPTADDFSFKQGKESEKYMKQMMTAGVDVDLN